MGRRSMLMAGIAVIGLAAAGCGGSTEKAGASALFHLQPGQCFHSSAGTAGRTVKVDDVSSLPCAAAHDGEGSSKRLSRGAVLPLALIYTFRREPVSAASFR